MALNLSGSGFPKNAEERFKANAKKLVAVLNSLGVTTVSVTFSGYGDSGNYDAPSYQLGADSAYGCDIYNTKPEAADITVPIWRGTGHWSISEQKHVHKLVLKRLKLNEAVETTIEDYIDAQHVDWWNNDGGSGEVSIDVEQATFTAEINVNYTQSECEFLAEDEL